MKTIKSIFDDMLSAIYPNKCVCCGELIDANTFLCNQCAENIERSDLECMCFDCGLEKDNCVCRYNIYLYRFNKLVSVFRNEGIAQDMYYSYKFSKRQHLVNFLSDEMCGAIKTCYSDISFECICAVPTFRKYGYDHSGYIAKAISKITNIPYCSDLLSCAFRSKRQHKSSFTERLHNVDGKYRCNYRLDGANILLVDDIKTTGATLDECARVLLFAGAESVYCITALGTSIKKQTKN